MTSLRFGRWSLRSRVGTWHASLSTLLTMNETAASESNMMLCCASCGACFAGGDDIKLMDCGGCDLVRYCSDACQEDHRLEHEEECKKRAAELHEEILFKQPESRHYGDCPICSLPLPIDPKKSVLMSCCSKSICVGCCYAYKKREFEGRRQPKCPFCRTALPDTQEEWDGRLMKRIEANDPVAMSQMGTRRYEVGDNENAFDYWTRAASLSDVEAHYQVSVVYRIGHGVDKDMKRSLHHTEKAAIGGHPDARHSLGCLEAENGRMDRAVKHWIIAAKLGSDLSLENVKNAYRDGYISKEDFAAALRGHHAAIKATESDQREEAAEFLAECGRRGIC